MIRDYSKYIGEQNKNKNGTIMTIIEFNKTDNITIQFEDEYKFIKKTTYVNFTRGHVKNPYDKTIYGVACIGYGRWKVCDKKGIASQPYSIWHSIISRCYTEYKQNLQPTYIDCSVSKEWLNFQNFADWFEENWYQVDNEKMELDKDILYKGNKIYSAETCIFVPKRINLLLINRKNYRGKTPLGVRQNGFGSFYASSNDENGSMKRLGTYPTKEKAFEIYKNFRENVFKKVADNFKGKIPDRLYDALHNRKIEITD
jgi:hypothetical protein